MFWKFQILKKALKRAKTLKNLKKQQKKTSIFFLFGHFHTGKKISLIKKACFMLNFLNLNSFCSSIQPQHTVWGHLLSPVIKRHFWSKDVKNHSSDSNKHTVVWENPSLWLLKTPRKLPVIKACRRLIVVHSIHLDFPS